MQLGERLSEVNHDIETVGGGILGFRNSSAAPAGATRHTSRVAAERSDRWNIAGPPGKHSSHRKDSGDRAVMCTCGPSGGSKCSAGAACGSESFNDGSFMPRNSAFMRSNDANAGSSGGSNPDLREWQASMEEALHRTNQGLNLVLQRLDEQRALIAGANGKQNGENPFAA